MMNFTLALELHRETRISYDKSRKSSPYARHAIFAGRPREHIPRNRNITHNIKNLQCFYFKILTILPLHLHGHSISGNRSPFPRHIRQNGADRFDRDSRYIDN